MDWKTLSRQDAAGITASWDPDGEALKKLAADLDRPDSGLLSPAYFSLRQDLCERFHSIRTAVAADNIRAADYMLDLEFGLFLYAYLGDLGFSPRLASYSPVWNYLSVAVVPDLVYERYGRISADRYYAKKRRIWLSSIWWYIHLSLQHTDGQPDLQATRAILLHNSTDTILQIVDRAGPGGYRVETMRELMRRYGEQAETDQGGKYLRRLMMLHVARVRLVEPALHIGGEKGYIEELMGEMHG